MRRTCCLAVLLWAVPVFAADWAPKAAPLMTRWAKDVDPAKPLPEYPRPTMVRADWQNLNGLWDYAIRPKGEGRPSAFDGKILVPFPVESALSGVMKPVGPDNRLWYHHTFSVPVGWAGKRTLLHFGASDWETTVWVNGKELGTHRGGYDPFTYDLTDALKSGGEQEIVVAVWDPSDDGPQPRGKQVRVPKGIWYTPTTGIWQTVWLEPVAQTYIESLHVVPDVDSNSVTVRVVVKGPTEGLLVVAQSGRGKIATIAAGDAGRRELAIKLTDGDRTKLWTPETPTLFPLAVGVVKPDGRGVDGVESYFALRKSSLGKDDNGVTRLMLNDKPVFQFGPLDQGFWPDGLYTAPTDSALKYDIEMTKKLGFNMARKHVKVEPERWYYWCDKLGLLVWQDMPSGDAHVAPGRGEITRSKESAEIYDRELKALIDARRNHPCIVLWVPFNEGWGQFDTVRVANWIKKYDPSRLVICSSGWNDYPAGDAHDIHVYRGPASPMPEATRAAVLGEYGGLGLPLDGHTWQSKANWGYGGTFKTAEALTAEYLNLTEMLHPLLRDPGLSAAVYTQTTDVEVEVNGLMTYDRAVVKMPEGKVIAAHRTLFGPPPVTRRLVATSQVEPQQWRYTTQKPADGWFAPTFDDAGWKSGPGGFGVPGVIGGAVHTEWKTPDIWARRTFELPDRWPADVRLRVNHREDAEVYLNGVLAARMPGHVNDYASVRIQPEAAATLRPGRNVLAVHCRQPRGWQYIDVGIDAFEPAK